MTSLWRWLAGKPQSVAISESAWIVAKQGASRLTVDELRSIGYVHLNQAKWPDLVDHCFSTGPDRPSQTD